MVRAALFAVALSLALPAQAQSKPLRPLAEELEGDARTSFEQGRALFEHGDFLTAHAKFRVAFEASGNPRLLWNLAACSSKLKRYGRALREAERYLEAGEALSVEQREKATAFVRELRSLVALVTFTVNPSEVHLTLDGEDRGVVGELSRHPLELGPHEVRLEREGFGALRQTVDVRDTSPATFAFRLEEIRALGRLVVEADPDARVDVDGTRAGYGLVELRLSEGSHRIVVTREGFEPFDAQVRVDRDATRQVHVTLRERDPWFAGWVPWALGGTLIAAGLGVGAYYAFAPTPVAQPFVRGSTGFDFELR